MRRLFLIVGLAAAGPAFSATPSTPPVPPVAQARIHAKAPTLAYVPTRIPIGFRYRRWSYEQGAVRIWFRNKTGWEIVFVAVANRGDCRAGREKTFQLAGNKIFWAQTANEQQAWRCLVGRSGRQIRLVAATVQPPNKFADVGLGSIVTSARRIR